MFPRRHSSFTFRHSTFVLILLFWHVGALHRIKHRNKSQASILAWIYIVVERHSSSSWHVNTFSSSSSFRVIRVFTVLDFCSPKTKIYIRGDIWGGWMSLSSSLRTIFSKKIWHLPETANWYLGGDILRMISIFSPWKQIYLSKTWPWTFLWKIFEAFGIFLARQPTKIFRPRQRFSCFFLKQGQRGRLFVNLGAKMFGFQIEKKSTFFAWWEQCACTD